MDYFRPKWFERDELLFRWVGRRTKATKKLYGKVWRRWLTFLKTKERWKPTPEEMIIDYEKDLKTPILKGGGETGRRIERFYVWLTTEYENPSVANKHLALSSGYTYASGLLSFYRNNTGTRVPLIDLFVMYFQKVELKAMIEWNWNIIISGN